MITDPYGAGWLFKVEPTDSAEREALMDMANYRAWVEPRLAEKLVPPVDEFSADEFDIDPNRGY